VPEPAPPADARSALGRVELGDRPGLPRLGTDLRAAVLRAVEVARSSTASSKEVYVLSDLQDSGWELADGGEATGEVAVNFIQVRPTVPTNAAVTAVQFGASRPVAGVPFLIRPQVQVENVPGATLTVRLFIDDEKAGERRLERTPGGWASPRFYHTFTKAGWHRGYVEVDDPSLPEDNRRYFTVQVLDNVRVLAVNGAPSEVPARDELFFLRLALTAGGAGDSSVRVDVVEPAGLSAKLDAAAKDPAADYPLVTLANVGSLPEESLRRLEEYVDRGHSLLMFLGDRTDPAGFNAAFAGDTRLHKGLSPARIDGTGKSALLGDPAGPETFAHISGVDTDHVALSTFADPKFAGLLLGERAIGLRAFWKLAVPEGADVLMGARMPAGGPGGTAMSAPLLAEKAFGKGRVMLFAGTCDRDWTNFPTRPAFLPWAHRLVTYLAQEPLGRDTLFTTGSEVPLPVAATEGISAVTVKKPDGTVGYARATGRVEVPLAFDGTEQAGIYAVFAPDRKDEPAALLAVNLDKLESDLTYLDDVFAERPGGPADREAKVAEGLKSLLPGGTGLVSYVPTPERAGEAVRAFRGLQLWDLALWVVLGIALFEPWLANQISLRHYGKARAVTIDPAVRGRAFAPAAPAEVAAR
jgi:hypothetical protein